MSEKKSTKELWSQFLNRTTFHGLSDLFWSTTRVEKGAWFLVLMPLACVAVYIVGSVINGSLAEICTYDSVIHSPTETRVYDLINLTYCDPNWFNSTAADELGMSPELQAYVKILLRIATGDGAEAYEELNRTSHLQHKRLDQELLRLLVEKDFGYIRLLYEYLTNDWAIGEKRYRLCPQLEGNYCPYTAIPQKPIGFVPKYGRMCVAYTPIKDHIAEEDPIMSSGVMFIFNQSNNPDEHQLETMIGPYLGDIIHIGVMGSKQDITNLDSFTIPKNCTDFHIHTRVNLFVTLKLNLRRKPCESESGRYLGADHLYNECKLRCLDEVFYKKRYDCSAVDPIFPVDRQMPNYPFCAPDFLYSEMLKADADNSSMRDYNQCTLDQKCRNQSSCSQIWSEYNIYSAHCASELNTKSDSQKVVKIKMIPSNILTVNQRLLYPPWAVYSSAGGILGLTLGASVVSVFQLLVYILKYLGMTIKSLEKTKTAPKAGKPDQKAEKAAQ